jgi:hypothetical protein
MIYILLYIYTHTLLIYNYESQPGSWLAANEVRIGGLGGGYFPNGSKIWKIGGKNRRPLVWFCRVMYQAAKQ